MSRNANPDPALLVRWVDTWRRAGEELKRIRSAELESVDTREAVRQIFDGFDRTVCESGPPTSGLVEQQMWFARLRPSQGAP